MGVGATHRPYPTPAVPWICELLQGFSRVAAPLSALTSTLRPFSWSPEAEAAFSSLKALFRGAGRIEREMGREVQTAQTEMASGESVNKSFSGLNSGNGGLGQQGVRKLERGCRSNRLKCLCLNARSIKNKFLELEAIIISEGYDIVGITETWLGEVDGDEFNIEGYKVIRKDRSSKRGEEGVWLFM